MSLHSLAFLLFTTQFLFMNDQGADTPAQQIAIPSNCSQLIIVVSSGWSADSGTMFLMEREGTGAFMKKGTASPVSLGKNGMAWGIGAADYRNEENKKKEGDGKSPAGLFELGFTFGFADPSEVTFTKMPYLLINEFIECIDDPGSDKYNKIVSTDIIEKKDWVSSEKMAAMAALYKWGMLVKHNWDSPEKSAGSCIFMHLWRNPGNPTVGCTAMAEENLLNLLKWIDPDKNPHLLQLPADVYKQMQTASLLPEL